MEIFVKIMLEAEKAFDETDMPHSLFVRIKGVCASKQGLKEDLETLLEMMEYYEPYADTGCASEAFSTKDVEIILNKITSE